MDGLRRPAARGAETDYDAIVLDGMLPGYDELAARLCALVRRGTSARPALLELLLRHRGDNRARAGAHARCVQVEDGPDGGDVVRVTPHSVRSADAG